MDWLDLLAVQGTLKSLLQHHSISKGSILWCSAFFMVQLSHPNMTYWKNHSFDYTGFHDSSVDKESTCNAGDLGSIPGLGRSAGERIGYPLPDCWASLAPQLVKNSPAMWETWVHSLGWEDPLEKEMATHSSILAWRIP